MKKVLLVILLATLLVPMYLMFKSSLESAMGLLAMPPSLIPTSFTFFHYKYLLTQTEGILRMAMNTIMICVATIVGGIIVTLMAGFAFQSKWPGQKIVVGLFLLSSVLPLMVLIIPRYLLMRIVGIKGGFVAAVLPHIYSPVGILIARAWMIQTGPSFVEQARLQGAGELQVLWHVVVPMSMPVVGLQIIGLGIDVMGDFLWQMMTLPMPNQQTLLVGLMNSMAVLTGPGRPDPVGLHMAMGVVLLVPMVAVFLIGQKLFVSEGKGLVL